MLAGAAVGGEEQIARCGDGGAWLAGTAEGAGDFEVERFEYEEVEDVDAVAGVEGTLEGVVEDAGVVEVASCPVVDGAFAYRVGEVDCGVAAGALRLCRRYREKEEQDGD